jgi:hypothetical protein
MTSVATTSQMKSIDRIAVETASGLIIQYSCPEFRMRFRKRQWK